MKSIKVNPDKTGWTKIDGDVKTIVVHFKNGHKEAVSLVDFLVSTKAHKQIVQIDCYKEGEEVKL